MRGAALAHKGILEFFRVLRESFAFGYPYSFGCPNF